MAVLSDNDRAATWAELMQEWSSAREPVGLTKADLRAAVNAIDTWLNDNAAAANAAIPQRPVVRYRRHKRRCCSRMSSASAT